MASLCGHMLLIFIFNLKGTDFLEALLPLSYNISILEFAILFCIANATSGGLEGIKYAIFRNVDLNSVFVWKKEEIILQVFQNHLYSMGLALGTNTIQFEHQLIMKSNILMFQVVFRI